MLDLFFQHMPDWATSVLVCSDDEKAYQCLSEFKVDVCVVCCLLFVVCCLLFVVCCSCFSV